MENRSLDDFLDGEESPSESAEPAEAVDPEGAEPAASTYASGTGECAACGESARERWRGEVGLVCPACKEW